MNYMFTTTVLFYATLAHVKAQHQLRGRGRPTAAAMEPPRQPSARSSSMFPERIENKVEVCHWSNSTETYNLITIDEPTYQSYLDEDYASDARPGEDVPDKEGYFFSATCEVLLLPIISGVWQYQGLDNDVSLTQTGTDVIGIVLSNHEWDVVEGTILIGGELTAVFKLDGSVVNTMSGTIVSDEFIEWDNGSVWILKTLVRDWML